MIILGIDPGTISMGYGIIAVDEDKTTMVGCGALASQSRSPIGERLSFLYRAISEIIDQHHPDAAAIEQPFLGQNVKAALAIGRAQAIAILAASNRGIPVHEYTPAQIKQRVADYGASSKEQIQEMVKLQLGLTEVPTPSDAADALAVALCHQQELHLKSLLAEQE